MGSCASKHTWEEEAVAQSPIGARAAVKQTVITSHAASASEESIQQQRNNNGEAVRQVKTSEKKAKVADEAEGMWDVAPENDSLNPKRGNQQNGWSKPSKPKKVNYLLSVGPTAAESLQDELDREIDAALERLDEVYGTSRGSPDGKDAVLVMEGWNKVLAFQTLFSEALFARWRIIVALETLMQEHKDRNSDSPIDNIDSLHSQALEQVEVGSDPIAKSLGIRLVHGRSILIAMVDSCVRSLCPHAQIVQREAYRPFGDVLKVSCGQFWGMKRLKVEEGSPEEYFRTFARCGVRPSYWVHFCTAYLWCLKTHSPYAEESDQEDLDQQSPMDGANARFVATTVAMGAIEYVRKFRNTFKTPLYQFHLPRFWANLTSNGRDEVLAAIGETFYRQLLTNHPELLDYFSETDMDSLAVHFAKTLDLMTKSIREFGLYPSPWRTALEHLNEIHRRLSIPTWAYGTVGGQLLATIRPFLDAEATRTKDDPEPADAEELEDAYATIYVELMTMIYQGMQWEESLIDEAEDFFRQAAVELGWSKGVLDKRLLEVKVEIQASGSYTHTSEELQIGARLAWRNSAKCIGRIAWNTLMVRDCRHVESPQQILHEVEEHLRIATGGTNIQSVMTVFKPKKQQEMWGTRFWSSQYVRYAGYKDEKTGNVLGDPANVEFTEYLIKHGLWTPPKSRSRFDVLPLVLKIPGKRRPFVHNLPSELVHEVHLEHPDYPAIKKLGLKWAAVPAISNFSMNIGGIDYQAIPFNGWFVSIEIARNLFERYKLAKEWATAMGISTKTKRLYEQRAFVEMDAALNYSFEKQGFTMVDMETVGQSFMVHCKRERDAGRECPAQWSWIGGLTGPTNVTWHHEMRDFYIAPQYEYCAEQWMVTELPSEYAALVKDADGHPAGSSLQVEEKKDENEPVAKVPRVLIAYGSETGTAEAAAYALAKAIKLCKPIVMSLNDVAGLHIVNTQRITHLLALTSTFGTGEFPSNANRFDKKEISPDCLTSTKVAVLALGSTLYPDFCRAGVTLNEILRRAGADFMVPLKKVDETTGTGQHVAQWIQLVSRIILPPNLEKILLNRQANASSTPVYQELSWMDKKPQFQEDIERYQWPVEEDPWLCCGNEELIDDGDIDSRSTRKISFKLPSGTTYETGDHLAVQPLNSMGMVRRFAMCFGDELVAAAKKSGRPSRDSLVSFQMQQPFSIDTVEDGERIPARLAFSTPATLADALQASVDLTLRSANVPELLQLVRRVLSRGNDKFRIEDVIQRHGLTGDHAHALKEIDSRCRGILDGESGRKDSLADQFVQFYPTVVDFLEAYGSILCSSNVSKVQAQPLLSLAELLSILPRLRAITTQSPLHHVMTQRLSRFRLVLSMSRLKRTWPSMVCVLTTLHGCTL